MQSLKQLARRLKNEVHVVYVASQDRRTPWYAKLLAVVVLAYAFSPIDLIPDCIPLLGYLDDLILVPLGIWLVVQLIPPHVLTDCREQAAAQKDQRKPQNWLAAGAIVALWIGLGVYMALRLKRAFQR